jgi:H+/Cl- antiporter ClcA
MPNFTPAQLLAELNTDPAAIGYAALIAAGNDAGVAALLNAPTTTSVYRNNIGVHEVVAAIAPADFAGLTTLQVAKLQLLFTGTTTIDASSPNTRALFVGIFAGMATSSASLTALASRPGSRAEVLWGTGTVVTGNDVSLALRGR